jgi:ankyrin repeat protein
VACLSVTDGAEGQAGLVKELIDAGMDVNARDFDREDTALHLAAAKGQKEVIEILVANGADVNAQNNRGQTALHSLVKKRFDLLALWLVRQGADINLEDDKNCSARDFALSWFQQELDGTFALSKASAIVPRRFIVQRLRVVCCQKVLHKHKPSSRPSDCDRRRRRQLVAAPLVAQWVLALSKQ